MALVARSCVFVATCLLALAACAHVPSSHWQDKATFNERIASSKIGGFSRDESRLYHNGLKHVINAHQAVGTLTIRQLVDQERAREAIRNAPKLRQAALERARNREQMLSAIISIVMIATGITLVIGIYRFVSWQRQARASEALRAKEASDYACYTVRLSNYNEALKLLERPVANEIRLTEGETAFYQDAATLIWDSGTEHVPLGPSVSKTSGGAAGAVVGGILLGPVGAVAGYAASRKTTITAPARTYQRTTNGIDPGTLIVTNQRLLFIGQRGTTIAESLTSVLQVTAAETSFADHAMSEPYAHGRMFGQNEVRFRRTSALPNERFIVRNLAYFMIALNAAGRCDLPRPAKPLSPARIAG
jgi:hypothetical protein